MPEISSLQLLPNPDLAEPRSSNVARNEHDLVADFDNKASYSSRDSVTSPNWSRDHQITNKASPSVSYLQQPLIQFVIVQANVLGGNGSDQTGAKLCEDMKLAATFEQVGNSRLLA
jgi:hypothetical protein